MKSSSSSYSLGDLDPRGQVLWWKRSILASRQPEVAWKGKFSAWTDLNNETYFACLLLRPKAKYILQKKKGVDFLQVINLALCGGRRKGLVNAAREAGEHIHDSKRPALGGRRPGFESALVCDFPAA